MKIANKVASQSTSGVVIDVDDTTIGIGSAAANQNKIYIKDNAISSNLIQSAADTADKLNLRKPTAGVNESGLKNYDAVVSEYTEGLSINTDNSLDIEETNNKLSVNLKKTIETILKHISGLKIANEVASHNTSGVIINVDDTTIGIGTAAANLYQR